jgi:biotin transporter BioY
LIVGAETDSGERQGWLPGALWHRSRTGSVALFCLVALGALVGLSFLPPARLAVRTALIAILPFLPWTTIVQLCALVLASAVTATSLAALAGFLKMGVPDDQPGR